eukprot:c21194_g1_i1 orf=550-1500(-)
MRRNKRKRKLNAADFATEEAVSCQAQHIMFGSVPSPGNLSGKSDSEADESSQDIVNVDFEFFDPNPGDFHGVKALLRSYLGDATWDLSGFVNIILAQRTVGTVIKTAEEESPIGVITALNIGRYKDHCCMKEIGNFLIGKSDQKQHATKLEAFLKQYPHDVGLLVSERLINLPVELALPLHEGLFDEISWATEDEPSQALRDAYKFKFYLLMTRVFEELPKRKAKGNGRKAKKEGGNMLNIKNREDSGESGKFIYIKPEDEIFHEMSIWFYTFPASNEPLAAHETKRMRQLGLVMAVAAEQIPVFRSQLAALVQKG